MAAIAERQQIVNENVEEVQAGPYPIDSLVVSAELINNRVAIVRSCSIADLSYYLHFY
jgi:hypothetical protein